MPDKRARQDEARAEDADGAGDIAAPGAPAKQNDDDEEEDDDDDTEDVGPTLPAEDPRPAAGKEATKRKRRRIVVNEKLYASHLPQIERYTRSYMHRDQVSSVHTSAANHFLMTCSEDGFVKFWKKQAIGIEFVKQYRAHTGPISSASINVDETLFATASATDKTVKVFDIINFDLFTMIQLDFAPSVLCWVHKKAQSALLAIADAVNPVIYIYDVRGDGSPIHTLSELHSKPVILLSYNPQYHCVISCDSIGNLEYWTPEGNYSKPSSVFVSKAATDLYDFRKTKSIPVCITMSPDGESFATISFPDREVRLFKFRSGKVARKYDESLAVISQMHESGTSMVKLDDIEFGKRLAREKELEKSSRGLSGSKLIFDESGLFLIYTTLLGAKVVNTASNACIKIYAKDEQLRLLDLAIYQGAPQRSKARTLAMAASNNPLLAEAQVRDPVLFATSYQSHRFYLFSSSELPESKLDRDAFNEKPTATEIAHAEEKKKTKAQLATGATMHTSIGDIRLTLFPAKAPKAVENFVTHSRNGYYDKTIFHRVIKQFMIQGGDPEGNGTGGTSIWGTEFEDELRDDIRHEQYTLSMANAGPDTNGSQFFITTAATPHLDGKHTIFGRVTHGFDVVHRIESAKASKLDRPLEPVDIHSIEIHT